MIALPAWNIYLLEKELDKFQSLIHSVSHVGKNKSVLCKSTDNDWFLHLWCDCVSSCISKESELLQYITLYVFLKFIWKRCHFNLLQYVPIVPKEYKCSYFKFKLPNLDMIYLSEGLLLSILDFDLRSLERLLFLKMVCYLCEALRGIHGYLLCRKSLRRQMLTNL